MICIIRRGLLSGIGSYLRSGLWKPRRATLWFESESQGLSTGGQCWKFYSRS